MRQRLIVAQNNVFGFDIGSIAGRVYQLAVLNIAGAGQQRVAFFLFRISGQPFVYRFLAGQFATVAAVFARTIAGFALQNPVSFAVGAFFIPDALAAQNMVKRRCRIGVAFVTAVKIIGAALNAVIFLLVDIAAEFAVAGRKLVLFPIADAGPVTGDAVGAGATVVGRFGSVDAVFLNITVNGRIADAFRKINIGYTAAAFGVISGLNAGPAVGNRPRILDFAGSFFIFVVKREFGVTNAFVLAAAFAVGNQRITAQIISIFFAAAPYVRIIVGTIAGNVFCLIGRTIVF